MILKCSPKIKKAKKIINERSILLEIKNTKFRLHISLIPEEIFRKSILCDKNS